MTTKGDLIKRALGGQSLNNWFPEGDHKKAQRAISSFLGWSDGAGCGSITKKGIELRDAYGANGRLLLFVPWSEVLEVVARGALPELRATYEAAAEEWGAYCRRQPFFLDDKRTSDELEADFEDYCRITDALSDAMYAIVDAGLETECQQSLFEAAS